MARKVILGNGGMLVCLDKNSNIRDFYYPYVGQENHVSGNTHRTGVWVDGKFSWISEDGWDLMLKYKKDTLVSEIIAYNSELEVELIINEAVHYDKNIFMRRVSVENKSSVDREIKVFFSQHFQISESTIGDTVYYDPNINSIISYKGKRYFLIGGLNEGKPFDDYATGVSSTDNKHGTYVDCEDGFLSKNPIEHGMVDSSIGFLLSIESNKSKEIDYWICAGQKYNEVKNLRNFILEETPGVLITETEEHWKNWLNNKKINFHKLNNNVKDLFRRSLLIVRAQTDNHGAIIAANDSHTLHSKKDTYSYMWPRDGALIARSLDRVGHLDMTKRFFEFCSWIVSHSGYLFHKYRPDGSLGSSWHSWLKGDEIQLPIQEDETALVLDALWKHYAKHKDDEMIKKMYEHFIKKAADFMVEFRDSETKLPKETYDLWEEKLGVHTFTCSTVYAGLRAAENFAKIFGTLEDSNIYKNAADEIKESTIKYMYDNDKGYFIKGIYYNKERKIERDMTVDVSSFYGVFEYNILPVDDDRLINSAKKTMEKLWCMRQCGGLARYEGDRYYRKHNSSENPWIISTMWLCEYYIERAKDLKDLKLAEELLIWTTEKASDSGVLSEQLDPDNSSQVAVAPLTWSHAGFIIACVKYLDKYEKLSKTK